MALTETQKQNYNNHCIIQWFGEVSRPQANFKNNNIGSRKITPSKVETKTSGKFNETDEKLSNSHKLTLNEEGEELIPQGTTDIFLYGHSA
ncbi:MAG: hypothetical protein GQ564_14785 [Bacteroidales bacterium]|nr:hypothetical protein [Bacteroidales bacterium]